MSEPRFGPQEPDFNEIVERSRTAADEIVAEAEFLKVFPSFGWGETPELSEGKLARDAFMAGRKSVNINSCTGWLVEMQGPSYLAARHLGGYEFYWTGDHSKAIRFINQEQADLVMMSVRQMRPELFPSCLPVPIRAVEHMWIPGEGFR